MLSSGAAEDEGYSLVEVLIALVLLGICALTLVGALGIVTTSTGVYRQQSDTGTALTAAAERLSNPALQYTCVTGVATGDVPTSYQDAAAAAALADGSGTVVTVVRIDSFGGQSFNATNGCTNQALIGYRQQLITLTARSAGSQAEAELRLVKRDDD